MSTEAMKKAVGYRAAELVQSGMLIGLGTGSTAFYFIERLIQKCNEGLKIQVVASSEKSLKQAEQGGLSLIDIEKVTSLDLTVDGADQIDPKKRMIKGGGGALVREKIIANMSRDYVVIVDETKCVASLGKCKLPIEVIPFAKMALLHHIEKAGFKGDFRIDKNGKLFISDNGNLIVDIHLDHARENPEKDHETLLHIPGVIDTGFFFNLAGRVIIGYQDGQVVVKP
jgi:ribose 5-phosphate isomerase A